MKLDSKYFDRIRVKPDPDRLSRRRYPDCEWPGCYGPGKFPAPKGRRSEGEYHHFCLEHVQRYNKAYNYFDGMKDSEFADYQRAASTGHRPTWRLGLNSAAPRGDRRGAANGNGGADFADPFGMFRPAREAAPERPARIVRNAELKALNALGLEASATAAAVKVQYKKLVKRHHPDANGGSRESEDKLREIIEAYAYLRAAGFC